MRNQIEQLTVRSPATGTYVSYSSRSLLGRFLQRGEVVGVVTKPEQATVRVLIPQQRITLVRQQTQSVSVRMADAIEMAVNASVSREVPRASQDLPSAALSFEGGGEIAVNPNSSSADGAGQLSAFQSWFLFDIVIDRAEDQVGLGERVYAKFSHGRETLGAQIYRAVRQTFLSHFNV